MDTSETYIKMCEKARKLQPDLQPFHMMESRKDLFYDYGDVWYAYTEGEGLDMVLHKVKVFRQDQLQEMVGDTPYYNIKNAMWSVLDDFRNFAFATNFKEYIPLTMEQLWLAFVMKEKYSKVWDGEKWTHQKGDHR